MNTPILSWIQQIGTAGNDTILGIKTDSQQNILIAGVIQGELATDQHQGSFDAYLAKYNSDGPRFEPDSGRKRTHKWPRRESNLRSGSLRDRGSCSE